jgi:hypothetical protein
VWPWFSGSPPYFKKDIATGDWAGAAVEMMKRIAANIARFPNPKSFSDYDLTSGGFCRCAQICLRQKAEKHCSAFLLLSYRASPSLERWLIPYVLYLSIACAQSELSKFFLR